ncbi:MAG: T9SS type A sorting domain-containing protein, partial [Marinilabiliaceae bacterium]|nr:T9SS type A sorting domain-containing protein [Marinilabiliaceae bacterium]
NITINWDEPESEDYTPIGYDIYRLNTQLNTTLLTETTYTDEGITEGVYAYNVVAVYAGNKESFAQMSNVICFSVPCERPIEVTGTIIDETTVHITWDDSENYEGELLGYNIYRDDIKLNEELLDVQEYYDDNLIGGTYIYKVSSSYDHCIESAPSDGLTIVIAAQFCETPLNLEVTAEQYTNTAVLTWDAPEIIDGTLLGYNIYRDGAKIIERAPTDRFYNDENLENGTYIYKVSAVYEHCAESGTTEEELITIFVPLYCETVADFTANVIPYTNAAKLNWNEPENFDMPILNYRVFKDGTLFGTLPSTIFEVLVPGLSDGTHYFEVNVIYDHCTSEKTELIEVEVYVPQLCDAPEDFSVEVEENDNNAFITWTEPEEIDGDLFGYNIYRNGVVINEDLIEELEYIDIDLPTGTYTYKVAAVYGHCEALLDGDGIVVEILLGISREVTNSFTMYPNPTNGSVTITGDQLTRIEIYDVQGRKYAEYTNIKGILHIDDLKKYDSGIYLVKMYSENNQAIIQRLTIIK